jgi:transcriptional regulator with XRE-family HTH domain
MGAYEVERRALLKSFGERLRALRSPEFGTQEELADASNLHRTHLGYLEQGRREPSLSTLLILSETLGVPVQALIDGLAVPVQRRSGRRRQRKSQ